MAALRGHVPTRDEFDEQSTDSDDDAGSNAPRSGVDIDTRNSVSCGRIDVPDSCHCVPYQQEEATRRVSNAAGRAAEAMWPPDSP